MKKFAAYLFVMMLVLGCKPRISLSGATIPQEANTVSIAYFANNTTLGPPSLSQRFTERLRDMVSQQTRLALVSKNGDLQFEGFLTEYNVAPVAIQSNDQAGMNRLTISVQVKFTNPYDLTKSFDQAFTRFADFKSSESIAAREADLTAEIFRQLTEDIFNRAFNNW